MTKPVGLTATVFVLSLALWAVLYVTSSPPTPPDGGETVILLGLVGVLVVGIERLVTWVRSRGRKLE